MNPWLRNQLHLATLIAIPPGRLNWFVNDYRGFLVSGVSLKVGLQILQELLQYYGYYANVPQLRVKPKTPLD